MKTHIISVLCLIVLLSGCKNQEKINVKVPYEDTQLLLGLATVEGLKQEPFEAWYNENYEAYKLNDSLLPYVKDNLKDVKIKTYMGTWCGDSQRETPHFIKILEAVDFNFDNFELIAVHTNKKTPKGLEEGFNITNVPTFIFYKNDEELNRIVEFPIESLEEDILKIISNQPYEHAYYGTEVP